MGMELAETIQAPRPAGAAWGTVNVLLHYLQMAIDHRFATQVPQTLQMDL